MSSADSFLLTGDPELDAKVEQWFKWDQNPETRKEMRDLICNREIAEVSKRLSQRLSFGTAGIRGCMKAGYNGMNDLVIIQTTQGLYKYLIDTFGSETLSRTGIVIGFDARHNSKRFAHRAASVFISNSIPVHLFSAIVPTPFIPYGVTELHACAGIMVTASHNPKQDNGYKVYFNNGAQIIPPHDAGIQSAILECLSPSPSAWDADLISKSNLISDPYDKIYKSYFKSIQKHIFDSDAIRDANIGITYTALHGVGHKFLTEALTVAGFGNNIHPVAEQMEPDPEFPTVSFPNPEEGKGVLDLSIQTGNRTNSSIILANDPDADRVALAEKVASVSGNGKNSENATGNDGNNWKIFTGNEIGTLLGWWIWFTYKENMKEKGDAIEPSTCYMMSSAVSASILKSMAEKEGFNFIETLTGFKWMGNIAHQLIQEKKSVLFAFEEAIGFMVGSDVLDKDGLSAGVALASMASYLKFRLKRSLSDQLTVIYDLYGYHYSLNSYFICTDADIIRKIFSEMKCFESLNVETSKLESSKVEKTSNIENSKLGTYIKAIGPFEISRIRDLHKNGFDSSTENNVPNLPTSNSFMSTFYFEGHNMKVTIRTSGTEPKVKYYSEIIGVPGLKNWRELDETLSHLIECVIRDCLKPVENGLIAKSD